MSRWVGYPATNPGRPCGRMELLNRRAHLCSTGPRNTHPSTIEVRGTTTAEPSGAGMERSAARATATESTAATKVTAGKTAATESTTTTVPSRQYGWTERKQSRAHETKYSFRFHSLRSRVHDLVAIARPLGFRMLPKSCRLLPLWSELPARRCPQAIRNSRSRFRPGTPALLRQSLEMRRGETACPYIDFESS